jgi:1,4-alpha-glucan branching enzyme
MTRLPPLTLVLALGLCTAWAKDPTQQPRELAPTATKDGVRFQLEAPNADSVYLAGSFNDWADNQDGRISDERFLMLKDAKTGVWTRVVSLDKGVYFMKYAVNEGREDQRWFAPDNIASRDHSNNAKFWVTAEGNVYFERPETSEFPTRAKSGEVTFQLVAPGVKSVHLAGEFNNWADNQDGRVTSTSAALEGPDENGVWKLAIPLAPGQHAYQFVIDGSTWIQDPNQAAEDSERHSLVKVE